MLFGIPGTPSLSSIAGAVGNTVAGAAAGLTFGYSTQLLNDIGINPNICSGFYTAGQFAGLFVPGLDEIDALNAAEEATAAADEGEMVYRVHGGQSEPWGHSWTPTYPRTLANPRDALGLPPANSGEYLTTGRVKDWTGVRGRRALPLGGTTGGAPEYLFPDPEGQIQHVSTQPMDPPF
jgi:hypothetical protein